MDNGSKGSAKMMAGLDLGDKYSHLCLLDTQSGEVLEEGRLRTTPEAIRRRFDSEQPLKIAIEVGTHSPWVSRLLEECGHMRSWSQTPGSSTSHLRQQAQNRQARRGESGPAGEDRSQALLYPLEHRSEKSQAHLALLHSREVLVRARPQLINPGYGGRSSPSDIAYPNARLRASTTSKVADGMPELLREALEPILKTIASLSARIRDYYDRKLEALAHEHYPETNLLRQVQGVGAL